MAHVAVLDCRGIASKCVMRELVVELLHWRSTSGKLCSLGPAQFETAAEFLDRVKNETPRSHIIPHDCDLVAFGDVHGDFLALLSHLYFAKVIDARGHWVGGNRWVCSTGDWVDRAGRDGATVNTSHNPREEVDIIQYVHALNLSAQRQGGGVLFTLGNHELYRVKAASEGTAHLGHHLGDQWIGWVPEGARPSDINKVWKPRKRGPHGYPGYSMSIYLAHNCPAVAHYGHTLLMHGGLESSHAIKNVDGLANQSACLYFKCLNPWNDDGLLQHVTMTRALSLGACPQADVDKTIEILEGPTQFVVGHTVQSKGDSPDVCSGRVWRLDFGMSEAFGRQGSVHVLLMTEGGHEVCFLSSHSVFEGKQETRTDFCVKYKDGKPISRSYQMVDRDVKRAEKPYVESS